MKAPSVFISHGAPLAVITEDDYAKALRGFGRRTGRPTGIVVVSAHGLSPDGCVRVTAGERPPLVYDFAGFPSQLYEYRYPCPGSPALAREIGERLSPLGLKVSLSQEAGIDHGVWVPLARLFPKADVPVVQVSMPFPSTPQRVFALGEALRPMREAGVMLIGSGGAVHNLRELDWHGGREGATGWARAFNDWLKAAIAAKRFDDILAFKIKAPEPQKAHPTTEHLFPTFFTIGAASASDRASVIADEFQYGTLSMFSYAFD